MAGIASSDQDPAVDGLTEIEHENLSHVVEMLIEMDELADNGLSANEIADQMATRFVEPPGGGVWDGPTVTKVMAVVESIRDEGEGQSVDDWPRHSSEPDGSHDSYRPDRRWALAGVGAVVLLALGAGAYGIVRVSGSSSPSATPALTSLAGNLVPATSEVPNPADLMEIRIEPPASEAVTKPGDLEAATATIRSDGLLHLEGAFQTQQQADEFIGAAAGVFGRDNIVESYIVDAAAPSVEVSDVALDKPVLFETGTATIDPSYIPFLEACGDVLRLNPQITMSIAGFADSIGDEAFNMELSQRRAEAIVDFYRSLEIDDTQLIGVGFGEADPVADNDTAEGRQQNRRVMLQLLNVMDEQSSEVGN